MEGNAVKPGAKARHNDHLLLAAETFGAIADLRFGTPYPMEPLREAWKKQVLYHEHSFGMRDGAGAEGRRQYAWKARLTERSEAIGSAASRAARAVGESLSVAAVLRHETALDEAHDVELQGNLDFVAGKGGSIAIIDVADPNQPKLVWFRHDPELLHDSETVLPGGNRLFLGADDFQRSMPMTSASHRVPAC